MKWVYSVAAILLYLLFLGATAPADVLFRIADHLGPDDIAVEGASGTLWQGAAQQVDFTPRGGGQAVSFGPVRWRANPLRLLLGEVAARFELGGVMGGSADAGFGFRGVTLHRVDLTLPAAWLASAHAAVGLLHPEGTLTIRARDFRLQPGRFRGAGEIRWDQAAFGLGKLKPLGGYRAEISGAGQAVDFRVETLSGPLELGGNGSWSPSGVDFKGSARARERASELRDALALMGTQQPDGSYAIRLEPRGHH